MEFYAEIRSFRIYGPFLPGPNVEHISGIQCTLFKIYALKIC